MNAKPQLGADPASLMAGVLEIDPFAELNIDAPEEEKPALFSENASRLSPEVVGQIDEVGRALVLASTAYRYARELSEGLAKSVGIEAFDGEASMAVAHLDLYETGEVDEAKVGAYFAAKNESLDEYRHAGEPDLAKMEAKLIELGINPAEFYLPGPLDAYAVSQRLLKDGQDPKKFIKPAVEVRLTPLKSSPRAEALDSMKSEASDALQQFVHNPSQPLIERLESFAARDEEPQARSGASRMRP